MRSASCGVVMEPSTSERSYGPLTTAREASRKLAISSSSATASSSSSQSSRLNWQPSQEANFHTASRGLRFRGISHLAGSQKRLDPVVAEHWTVAAHESGAELAVAAEADGAFHVAFHRDVDALPRHAAALECARR